MELRDVLSKKPIKFLTLLLTAMLVASASAAVYYSLSMQSTVTVNEAVVHFDQGSDWTAAGGSMGGNNTYVTLSIKAYPNATLTYDQPLVINNTDSSDHMVRLRHVSITPNATASVSNFTFINFTLNSIDFDYTTSGNNWNAPSDMDYQNLPQNTEWDVKIETKAAAGATNATTCTLVIALDVQE